jgi:RNA polymerase sigma-70 factor (ECF subfamily)
MPQGERALRAFVDSAYESAPSFGLLREDFLAHLETLGGDAETLRDLAGADLLLACACAQRLDSAIEALERDHFVPLAAELARLSGGTGLVEEAMQNCRRRLLAEEPPHILRYSGRGRLRDWLRVVVTREALALQGRFHRETPSEEPRDLAGAGAIADGELGHLQRLYSAEFQEAFREALRQLTTRERNVLRHVLLDHLTETEVGKIYNVHRVTVARWISRARETIVEHTRRTLQDRLRASDSEFQSVLHLIRSQLDVSLGALLSSDE